MVVGGRVANKLVFIDIDGTYAVHGLPPAGHVAAVRAARDAGNRVFLCTGRSKAMLSADLLDPGFDGIVASAGAYVELGHQVLADRRFPPELAARTVKVLDAHRSSYMLEAPDALYGRSGMDVQFRRMLAGTGGHREPRAAQMAEDILARLVIREDLGRASFAKVAVVDSVLPSDQLAARVGPEVSAVPSSLTEEDGRSGELYLSSIDKALGIRDICTVLGVGRESVVAFGDGLNDIEMLEYAGIGVAIEGADPRLAAVADRMAPGPSQEGLVRAFADLGLV